MICPKCEREQPDSLEECNHCGVIFSKVMATTQQIKPRKIDNRRTFAEPGEVLILRIVAWIHLVLGVLGGFMTIVRAENVSWVIALGIVWVLEAVTGSVLLFAVAVMVSKSAWSSYQLDLIASRFTMSQTGEIL